MNQAPLLPGVPSTLSTSPNHLSDDTLDDLLIETATLDLASREAAVAHLAACSFCRARQQTLELALTDFRNAALAWSEARSNTLNRDLSDALAAHVARGRVFGLPVAFAGPLLASLMVLAALALHFDARSPHAAGPSVSSAVLASGAAPLGDSQGETRGASPVEGETALGTVPANAVGPTRSTTKQTANDNAMLEAIDSAIYTPDPSPAELYRPLNQPENIPHRIEE